MKDGDGKLRFNVVGKTPSTRWFGKKRGYFCWLRGTRERRIIDHAIPRSWRKMPSRSLTTLFVG